MRVSSLVAAFAIGLAGFASACGVDEDDLLSVEPAQVDDFEGKADKPNNDGVEIKAMIAVADHARAVSTLSLTPKKASQRSIYFYDEPSLALFDAGLILRARKVKDGADDSTVKMRPLVAADVDSSWFKLPGWKCEADVTAQKTIASCSLSVTQDQGEIDDVATNKRTIDKLFSGDQEDFASGYSEKAPVWSKLRVLGPVASEVWKVSSSKLSVPLTVERWTLPDGTVLLEVSVKTTTKKTASVQAELDTFLAKKKLGVDTAGETKTRAVLEYYADRI